MREYKFRAWSHGIKSDTPAAKRKFGEWIHPTQMLYDEKPGDCLVWKSQGQNIEVMQYTGLKDRNGKEIYEGDIVATPTGTRKYVVAWDDTTAGFYGEMIGEKDSNYIAWEYFEVIGNIYEHPHLIDKGESA